MLLSVTVTKLISEFYSLIKRWVVQLAAIRTDHAGAIEGNTCPAAERWSPRA